MPTRTLNVSLAERSYPILIGEGLIDDPRSVLAHLAQKRVAVVTNTTVGPLYLRRFVRGIEAHGVQALEVVDRKSVV